MLIGRCLIANSMHPTTRTDRTRPLVRDKDVDSLPCLFRQTYWTITFHLVANSIFCVCVISVYLANAKATQIKIKIEPPFILR